MTPSLHPTLIQANLALFEGNRAEALRLLRQYEAERPADADPHRSMVLWLEAQTQTDDEARIHLLHQLLQQVDVKDPYSQMARDYLQAEEAYADPIQRSHAGWWATGAVIALVLVGGVVGASLFTADSQGAAVLPTPTVTVTTPPNLPDRSEPLVAPSFTARYERGILQVAALEDDSARVIDSGTGQVVLPVAGARFFALEIAFECRSGVCDEPPQAALTLRTGTEDDIAVKADVQIANTQPLQPVALGRTTRGWVVFEIPTLSRVEALHVKPLADENDTPPLVIDLPTG
jgi:hypothetical protein